ncbi:MAG: hypothetical protein Q9200_002645 [Gallowayella weberi]
MTSNPDLVGLTEVITRVSQLAAVIKNVCDTPILVFVMEKMISKDFLEIEEGMQSITGELRLLKSKVEVQTAQLQKEIEEAKNEHQKATDSLSKATDALVQLSKERTLLDDEKRLFLKEKESFEKEKERYHRGSKDALEQYSAKLERTVKDSSQNHDKLITSKFNDANRKLNDVQKLSEEINAAVADLERSGAERHDNTIQNVVDVYERVIEIQPAIEQLKRVITVFTKRGTASSPLQQGHGKRGSETSPHELAPDARRRRRSGQESPGTRPENPMTTRIPTRSSAQSRQDDEAFTPAPKPARLGTQARQVAAPPTTATIPARLGTQSRQMAEPPNNGTNLYVCCQIDFSGDGWTDAERENILGFIQQHISKEKTNFLYPVEQLDGAAKTHNPQCLISRWHKIKQDFDKARPSSPGRNCQVPGSPRPCIEVKFTSVGLGAFSPEASGHRWSLSIRQADDDR